MVKSEQDEMEREGITERSSSEWAFPIDLVKKDGSLRMCIDYRRLNAITDADAYPMPHVDDMIDDLGKSKYITLDLARSYWQVLVRNFTVGEQRTASRVVGGPNRCPPPLLPSAAWTSACR